DSVIDGHSLPQYPDAALAANADKFNVIVGEPGDGLPGFSRLACFGAGAEDDPRYCVFTRPGGCR
ncbi:MAG: hypothetical protein P4L90_25295, partial [Rhodopila sp.]|nr:hypothetical protein [Rhodopila sp.]